MVSGHLLVCLTVPGRDELIPMSPAQFDRWDEEIGAAEASGQATINLPGTTEAVPVADARTAADWINGPLHAAEPPARPYEHEPKPEKLPGRPPTLIIRANIAALEHPEHA